MASSPERKIRIAASVLFAAGFFDALAGRFLLQPTTGGVGPSSCPAEERGGGPYADLAGAVHLHSDYSDGAGDVPTVMREAREAGVDFVLLTDHNTQRPLRDGWEDRFPEPPYLLIGTEITVEAGAFLLALDMPAEWEPTKHQPPQVAIDEVRAHGGIPLVSLPFDVKHPWTAWDATGCLGLEIANLSTLARRHINLLSLAWLLPIYRARGPLPVLQALLTRPDAALARWDSLTDGGGASVGIGALDAHALMKIGKKKYPIPSYADSMRATTTHFLVPRDIASSGDPRAIRRALYDALRAGRCYVAYDCLGDPRPLRFTAESGTEVATMGQRIARKGGHVLLTARAAPGTLLRLYHRGRVVAAGRDGCLRYAAAEPGAYRVEGYKGGARIGPLHVGARPWIFTNPVYVD